jgi:hypothetical protein
MERTLRKAVWYAHRLSPEAHDALVAAHRGRFGRGENGGGSVDFEPTLMSDHRFSLHDAVDVLLFAARNSRACDRRLYRQLSWTCMLLLSNDEPNGRLVMQAMTEAGFVFDDDADRAMEALVQDRSETPMEKLLWHTRQLMAALPGPSGVTVARVYNHMVQHCMLPTPPVKKATENDLKRLVRAHAVDKMKKVVLDYIREYCTGARRRLARVDDDTESVAVHFQPRRRPGADGAFFDDPRTAFRKIVGVARRLCIPAWAEQDADALWRRFRAPSHRRRDSLEQASQ